MNIDFKNKKVVIVGGSGRIGFQMVKDFSSLDANLLVLDIKPLKIKKDNIKFVKLKENKLELLEKKIPKILNAFGCPNIFINSSYPRTVKWNFNDFKKINSKEISKNTELHQNSYMLWSIFIANMMKKNKIAGSIINLNSIYGLKGQNLSNYTNTNTKESPIYVTMKHGLSGLTKSMASYYGQYNIRVNSLCPGGVFNDAPSNKKELIFFKNYLKNSAIKRMCESKDISNAAMFLSSEYSKYITGVNLPIDGGFSCI